MAPSPLNPVKLELALILVVGLLLVPVGGRWLGPAEGVAAALAYGSAGAAWLVWRTRRALHRARAGEGA